MSLGAHLARVGRCLALDAVAVEAVAACSAAGVPVVLLKGPATVHWLYADRPGEREYVDIDLLVAPDRWADATAALCAAGFADGLAGARPSEAARYYERSLRRDGLKIDLHRGFFGVRDQQTFWAVVHERAVLIEIANVPTPVADETCSALVYALHAAQNGGRRALVSKPQQDLERSLDRFGTDVWRAASELARHADAVAAFAAGLALAPAGVDLLDRLGVPATADPLVRLYSTTHADSAELVLGIIAGAAGWRARLVLARDFVFPSRAMLVVRGGSSSRESVRRHRLRRIALAVTLLPRGVRRWLRVTRSDVARPLAATHRHRLRWVPGAALRAVRTRDRTGLATVWWTLTALRAARRQLRTCSPDDVVLPPVRPVRVGPAALVRARHATVRRILLAGGATCLQECVVRQRWLAAAGISRGLVVGVTTSGGPFRAHAWLDGEPGADEFVELTRYAGPVIAPQ